MASQNVIYFEKINKSSLIIKGIFRLRVSQPVFTYSKLTIETLEQRGNMFKVNIKDTNGVVLVPVLLTLNIFHTLFLYFYC